MKIYMGYWSVGKEAGACLIFANSSKQAKPLVYECLKGWLEDTEWTQVRVNLIRNKPHLFEQANQELLKKNVPHYIESPRSCKKCGWWGEKLNEKGICESCLKEVIE